MGELVLMQYISIARPYYEPGLRWEQIDAMFAELLGNAGLSAAYRSVVRPYFNAAIRWATIQSMLDALSPAVGTYQVFPSAFDPSTRWPMLDAALAGLYAVPVNALLSPVDNRVLLSPVDGRILLRAA